MRMNVVVNPRAARDELVSYAEGVLRVRVTAIPEHGKANEAVCHLLADALRIPVSSITVLRGPTSRKKVIELPDEAAGLLSRMFKCNNTLC